MAGKENKLAGKCLLFLHDGGILVELSNNQPLLSQIGKRSKNKRVLD